MMEGAPAFRDIGGLPTRDGRQVRKGRVFRSDALEHLTPRDLVTFRRLGIRTLCDLRSEGERHRHPNRLPDAHGCEVKYFGILTDVRAGDSRVFDALRERPDAAGANEMMMRLYRRMPEAFVPHMAPLLRRIAEGALPLLIHCTAGKDRTGFAVAVLLLALGVTRRDIVGEYLLTSRHPPSRARLAFVHDLIAMHLGHSPPPDVVEPVLFARTDYIEAALDAVDAAHGSVDGYLRQACGLDTAELDAVHQALLD